MWSGRVGPHEIGSSPEAHCSFSGGAGATSRGRSFPADTAVFEHWAVHLRLACTDVLLAVLSVMPVLSARTAPHLTSSMSLLVSIRYTGRVARQRVGSLAWCTASCRLHGFASLPLDTVV